MPRRSLAPFLFGPISLFVAAMVLIAALVTHPPLLGWIGLGLLAAALAVAAGVLFTAGVRGRSNAPRLHPREGAVHRLLVVLDTDIEPDELCLAVLLRTLARRTEVCVVAPTMPASQLAFLADDEDAARSEAEARLNAALEALAAVGIVARGVVGTDEPLQAVGDVLTPFPADEILLVAALPSRRTWLDRQAERQIRDLFGVPVSTSYGRAGAGAPKRQPGRPGRGQRPEPGRPLRFQGARPSAPQRTPKEIS